MVNRLRGRLWIAALPLAVYWLAIFTATHLPGKSIENVHGWDKAAHFGAYFGLALLLAWVLAAGLKSWLARSAAAIVIIAIYAALDEALQVLTPGRTPDWKDWLADVAGAACGLVFYGAALAVMERQ
jgi:VanZ family protein